MLDVLKLKEKFIHEYRSRSVIFYIPVVNNQMETEDVTSELIYFFECTLKKCKCNIRWIYKRRQCSQQIHGQDILGLEWESSFASMEVSYL